MTIIKHLPVVPAPYVNCQTTSVRLYCSCLFISIQNLSFKTNLISKCLRLYLHNKMTSRSLTCESVYRYLLRRELIQVRRLLRFCQPRVDLVVLGSSSSRRCLAASLFFFLFSRLAFHLLSHRIRTFVNMIDITTRSILVKDSHPVHGGRTSGTRDQPEVRLALQIPRPAVGDAVANVDLRYGFR